MIDTWLPLLEKLSLSRTEREVLKRFRSDPEGRSFLPIADILRAHGKIDESLELLVQGVNRHPRFTVARVVLARDLFRKGLIAESWQCLEDSPISIDENILAQKLKFKMTILMRDESGVLRMQRQMTNHKMVDPETQKYIDLITVSGIARCREELVRELVHQGISADNLSQAGMPQRLMDESEVLTEEHVAKPRLSWNDPAAGFHVVPLAEVFRPRDLTDNRYDASSGSVELDSTTLADIYAGQGHYGKALGVYRRLLRLNPNNDFLRKKVAELTRLDRIQNEGSTELDAGMVDQMEQLEIIDSQIQYLHSLMEKLT